MSLLAQRCLPRALPPPTTESAKQGLRYERSVVKALRGLGFTVEHNPWFEYTYGPDWRLCSPDIIVLTDPHRAFVVEVKLTYTPIATKKLLEVYCPVVQSATGRVTSPVTIYKHATPQVNQCPHLALQWLGGRSPMVWPL